MWGAIGKVLRSPGSLALLVSTAVGVFLLQVWLPDLGLIWHVVTSSAFSPGEKVGFLWASVGAIRTNFTVLGAWLVGAVSILFGLSAALTVRYLRERLAVRDVSGMGVAGLLAALVGVGCSACGAVVLSALVGATATASFVGLLPLRGQEFTLLSAAILAAAVVVTARKLAEPVACELPGARDVREIDRDPVAGS